MSIPVPPGTEPTMAVKMINTGGALKRDADALPRWRVFARRRLRADARMLSLAGAYTHLNIRPR